MAYERAGFVAGSNTSFKNILANDDDVTTKKITVLSGQVQPAGAVMGQITSGGKYILSLSAASDGSQTPDLILAEDVDASGGDREAIAYEHATVVATALTLGTAHTIASIRAGLRAKGIYIDD